MLCAGTAAFARPDSAVFTPCQSAYSAQPAGPPCPAPVRILCPLLHTHPAWPGLMLGSPRPPPALHDWPLTEPKSPLHFAATLPPTVLRSCLVNLDSIQLQNHSECTKRNCRIEICCLCQSMSKYKVSGNTRPPAVLRSWSACSDRPFSLD